MKKLEEVLSRLAHEPIPDDALTSAAARVRAKLFGAAPAVHAPVRSCADYQALIPAYLDHSLSAGRALLLQDHTRECVVCRHALTQARAGFAPMLVKPVNFAKSSSVALPSCRSCVIIFLSISSMP